MTDLDVQLPIRQRMSLQAILQGYRDDPVSLEEADAIGKGLLRAIFLAASVAYPQTDQPAPIDALAHKRDA